MSRGFLTTGANGACVVIHNVFLLQICSAFDAFLDYQPAKMLNFWRGAVILDELGIVSGGTMILDGSVYPQHAELMIISCFHHGAQSVIRRVAQF